jgi:hypothetical protein
MVTIPSNGRRQDKFQIGRCLIKGQTVAPPTTEEHVQKIMFKNQKQETTHSSFGLFVQHAEQVLHHILHSKLKFFIKFAKKFFGSNIDHVCKTVVTTQHFSEEDFISTTS